MKRCVICHGKVGYDYPPIMLCESCVKIIAETYNKNHLLKEPTFTLPQKKTKAKKRWINDQRYKPKPSTSDCAGCDLIAKRARHGACPYVLDCDKDHIIWKLAMPKPHPLDMDNLPKGFTPERWFVEYRCDESEEFQESEWNNDDSLVETEDVISFIKDGWEYCYTKKAPK